MLAMFKGIAVAEPTGLDLKSLQQVIHNSAGRVTWQIIGSSVSNACLDRRMRSAIRGKVFTRRYRPIASAAKDLSVFCRATALTQQLLAKIVGYNPRS